MKQKSIYKFISVILCVVLCMALCGCESWNNFRKAFIDPPQPDVMTIKVGILEPQTGRQSYDAEDEVAGMELAHELFPIAGTYKVELLYEDNRSNTDICKEATQKLIDRGSAVILGSVSDTLSLAASDVINSNQTPAIAATCTVPILTQTNPYYLRVNVVNSFDAEGAAEYAYKVLGEKAAVVLLPQGDDYAKTKAEVFESEFIKYVGHDSFEYSFTEIDESGKEIEKSGVTPTVYYITIDGTEGTDEMHYVFEEMNKVGCYAFYSPCKSDLALPWILEASNYEFPKKEPEQPKVPDNLTTMGYYDQDGNWVEEVGYWDEWGSWVKYEEPQPQPEPEEVEEKHFSWIGTDLWEGIESDALSLYGAAYMLYDVCYTKSYDSTISQSEMSKTFLDAYHKKYGNDAVPSNNFALGFDAYLLAYTAMCNVIAEYNADLPDDPEEYDSTNANQKTGLFDANKVFNKTLLTEALYKIKGLQGATGTITMNQNGDPSKDIIIEAFDGSGFTAVYTSVPDEAAEEAQP